MTKQLEEEEWEREFDELVPQNEACSICGSNAFWHLNGCVRNAELKNGIDTLKHSIRQQRATARREAQLEILQACLDDYGMTEDFSYEQVIMNKLSSLKEKT